jgi:hypothetical protein
LALAPLALEPPEAAELRLGAIGRILSAQAFPAQHARASILATLATK